MTAIQDINARGNCFTKTINRLYHMRTINVLVGRHEIRANSIRILEVQVCCSGVIVWTANKDKLDAFVHDEYFSRFEFAKPI